MKEKKTCPARNEKKQGRLKRWWHNHKPTKRRIIQLYAALLTNANVKGFGTGRIYMGKTKYLCAPGLNCYSCPGAVGACPLGALQNALAQSGTRMPFYVIGILLLFGLLFARAVCGFLCPFGLIQDLLYKIKTPKLKKSRVTRVLSYLKYVILAVFVAALPTIYGVFAQTAVPAFCKYICPAGTLGGAMSLLANPSNADMFSMLGGLFTWKFCLMVGIVLACVFVYRAFCRFLCPLGAIYGFFNKIALFGIKLDKNKCTDCGLCVAHCKMDIRHVGDHECINCGECIGVCPAKAISWKGKKLFVHPNAQDPIPDGNERPLGALLSSVQAQSADPLAPALRETAAQAEKGAQGGYNGQAVQSDGHAAQAEKGAQGGYNGQAVQSDGQPAQAEKGAQGGRESAAVCRNALSGRTFWLRAAAWGLAVAVLAGALVWFNVFDDSAPIGASGNEINEVSDDFTLPYSLKEGSFTLSQARGKIVVINFWATWCGPCVTELPEFERIGEEYEDRVTVVAVHSSHITEDVVSFLHTKKDVYDETRTWSDWTVSFVQDSGKEPRSDVYDMYGGKGSYPMTVIIDAEGVIKFKREGSVTYRQLRNQIELALL